MRNLCILEMKLSILLLQKSLLLAIPVPLFDGLTLVVLFFPLGQGDFHFRPATLPIQAERNNGIAVSLGGADELAYFSFMKK